MHGTGRSTWSRGVAGCLVALPVCVLGACTSDGREYSKPLTRDTASSPVTDTAPTTDDSATDDSTPTDTATTAPPDCIPPAPIAVDPDPECPAGTAALLNGLGYATVAEALALAVNGDLVEVCPGLWPANLVVGAGITLSGRAGWEATVLDGRQAGTVVAAEYAVVEGLTLACGEAEYGGGASLYYATLRAARVTGNHAVWDGGGIYAYASVVGPGMLIDGNAADGWGGGVSAEEPAILDTTISANVARRGAGFHIEDRGDLVDVTVQGNAATEEGGGGSIECLYRGSSEVNLSGVTFEANTAVIGGGLAAEQPGGYTLPCITIADSVFQGNTADLGGATPTLGPSSCTEPSW